MTLALQLRLTNAWGSRGELHLGDVSGATMDDQTQDRVVMLREEVEQFRSQVRFLLDEMHMAVDAPDNAPWIKPGDITIPIETAVDEIKRSLADMTDRIGPVTCESCGLALGWDDLGHGRTRCAACTSSYEI